MLSLRSLASILCSARRRARALSCAALHCFPDINGERRNIRRNIATNNATKMATADPMYTLLLMYTRPKAITARGAKDPFVKLRNGRRNAYPARPPSIR
jgi:hypothetical protein